MIGVYLCIYPCHRSDDEGVYRCVGTLEHGYRSYGAARREKVFQEVEFRPRDDQAGYG